MMSRNQNRKIIIHYHNPQTSFTTVIMTHAPRKSNLDSCGVVRQIGSQIRNSGHGQAEPIPSVII